jgi:hypothetical protein
MALCHSSFEFACGVLDIAMACKATVSHEVGCLLSRVIRATMFSWTCEKVRRAACKQAAECVFPAGLTRGLRENAGVYIGLAPQISELVLCLPILQVEGLI